MNNHHILVSSQWLVEHLNDEKIVIIDCRFSLLNPEEGRQLYQLNHISGAYYLDLNLDLSAPIEKHGGRHPLPEATEFAKKISAMGVTEDTLVIAYDDSRLAFAARLWWLLRYFGHEKVVVLEGGWQNWLSSGYPVSDIIPQQRTGSFVPHIQPQMLVDVVAVKSLKDTPGVVLVDSRENERYLGIREPIDKIAGHIPGAVNYPWQDTTDPQGYLLAQEKQYQRWETIKDADEILVYCGSGVTACVNLLSLELAGICQAKLYAGSWSDWISYD